jgi:hypothetical protein
LLAANLITYVKPVDDISFGEGQPELPIGQGLRIVYGPIAFGSMTEPFRHYFVTTVTNGVHPNATGSLPGWSAESIDRKIDDGMPNLGKMIAGWACNSTINGDANAVYATSVANCSVMYKTGF